MENGKKIIDGVFVFHYLGGIKMNNRNKSFFYVAIFLVLVFYAYYSIPRKFESNLKGIEYRLGDESYSKEVSISFEGWYRRKIFSSDTFQGSMTIGDTKLTQLKLSIKKNGDTIIGINKKTSDYESFGVLYSTDRFQEFTIAILEKEGNGGGSWGSKDGLMISAPTDNREDAFVISKKLMKERLEDSE